MNTTTSSAKHLIARIGFTLGVATFVASCACAPFNPTEGAGGTSTTTDPNSVTTTTADPGGTTTTTDPGTTTTTADPGGTTTTIDPGGTTTTTVPGGEPGEVVNVDDLAPQDCATPADEDMFIDDFTLTDCDTPHRMEVIASFEIAADTYPDDAYPGNTKLLPDSYEACQAPFEAYVGVPFWDSEYDITTITPSPSTWADGDRTITCLLITVDETPLNAAAYNTQR